LAIGWAISILAGLSLWGDALLILIDVCWHPRSIVMSLSLHSAKMGSDSYHSFLTMTSQKTTPRNTLNLRIKPEERDLIDMAAKIKGKNRTDFILEAARTMAEETLLERTIFWTSPEAYAEFLALLDAPPQPNERLRKTMQTSAPWDKA
jgi:uncharacterized protein (DUF1778 family)